MHFLCVAQNEYYLWVYKKNFAETGREWLFKIALVIDRIPVLKIEKSHLLQHFCQFLIRWATIKRTVELKISVKKCVYDANLIHKGIILIFRFLNDYITSSIHQRTQSIINGCHEDVYKYFSSLKSVQ